MEQLEAISKKCTLCGEIESESSSIPGVTDELGKSKAKRREGLWHLNNYCSFQCGEAPGACTMCSVAKAKKALAVCL